MKKNKNKLTLNKETLTDLETNLIRGGDISWDVKMARKRRDKEIGELLDAQRQSMTPTRHKLCGY